MSVGEMCHASVSEIRISAMVAVASADRGPFCFIHVSKVQHIRVAVFSCWQTFQQWIFNSVHTLSSHHLDSLVSRAMITTVYTWLTVLFLDPMLMTVIYFSCTVRFLCVLVVSISKLRSPTSAFWAIYCCAVDTVLCIPSIREVNWAKFEAGFRRLVTGSEMIFQCV